MMKIHQVWEGWKISGGAEDDDDDDAGGEVDVDDHVGDDVDNEYENWYHDEYDDVEDCKNDDLLENLGGSTGLLEHWGDWDSLPKGF